MTPKEKNWLDKMFGNLRVHLALIIDHENTREANFAALKNLMAEVLDNPKMTGKQFLLKWKKIETKACRSSTELSRGILEDLLKESREKLKQRGRG